MRVEKWQPLTAAQQELVLKNWKLAFKVANRYRSASSRLSDDDAASACTVGLCLAALTFDPSRACKFCTHAVWVMRSELRKAEQVTGSVSLPGNKLFIRSRERPLSINLTSKDLPSSGGSRLFDRLMEQLSTDQAAVISATVLCDCGSREVADLLGISHQKVSSIKKNALLKLRRWIERKRSRERKMNVGDIVKLHVPENPRLNNARGVVESVDAQIGVAHVLTGAAASGRFRALFEELTLDEPEWPQPQTVETYTARAILAQGFTGSVCDKCGSFRMARSGSCETCLDCGSAGGCG